MFGNAGFGGFRHTQRNEFEDSFFGSDPASEVKLFMGWCRNNFIFTDSEISCYCFPGVYLLTEIFETLPTSNLI